MSSHFQTSYRQSASKLHKAVGEILKTPPFSNYKVYQEYSTKRLCPTFKGNRCKFDWVIVDLKLVIECHGEFHYQPIKISKEMTDEDAHRAFKELEKRDFLKREAALQAGYTYLVIPYWDLLLISAAYILEKIPASVEVVPHFKKPKREATLWELKQKEKAKAWRKEAYQRFKEKRNAG